MRCLGSRYSCFQQGPHVVITEFYIGKNQGMLCMKCNQPVERFLLDESHHDAAGPIIFIDGFARGLAAMNDTGNISTITPLDAGIIVAIQRRIVDIRPELKMLRVNEFCRMRRTMQLKNTIRHCKITHFQSNISIFGRILQYQLGVIP